VQLLISVAGAGEVRAAVTGGADIVDAKDPAAGALGAVARAELVAIARELGGVCRFSVALGDAPEGVAGERAVRSAAQDAARAGAEYVKVGFAGCADVARAAAVIAAAVDGVREVGQEGGSEARRVRVVAVAYADAGRARSVPPEAIVDAAVRGGGGGVLLDTAFKDGGGLFDLLDAAAVAAWVREAEAAGLVSALAGKLDGGGVVTARSIGPHIVGVRGAACVGGRSGRISPARVRELVAAVRGEERSPAPEGRAARSGRAPAAP
jgi:(5-formylfuran-3-yl)methyl phosphate synthase